MKLIKVFVSTLAIGSSVAAPLEPRAKKDDLDTLEKVWRQDSLDKFRGKKMPRVVRKCVRCNADATVCDVVLCHLEVGYLPDKTPEEVQKTGRPLYAVTKEHEEDWLTAEEASAVMDRHRQMLEDVRNRKKKKKEEKDRIEREWYEQRLRELKGEKPQTPAEKKAEEKKKEEEEERKMEEERKEEERKVKQKEEEERKANEKKPPYKPDDEEDQDKKDKKEDDNDDDTKLQQQG
ncbi:hypothetical protein E4U43_004327 [Claviceps pusilla]|uniref:Uncharacterized protein n=1 Tax=Claviceps pusilla TaxID=123648 RepID=A0A9P7NHE3_9HYPO|nr:hypothetical protein E4U43_004327 [Claviceps pusilla]